MINRAGRAAAAVRVVRNRWDYLRWKAGRWERPGSPHLVKQNTILRCQTQYRLHSFVETGTFLGDMLAAMEPHFDRLMSIELSPTLHQQAQARFRSSKTKIRLLQGDSAIVLPAILAELEEASVFWLDAHYSGAMTARGTVDSPVMDEVTSILRHPVEGHVLLLDDARMFDGRSGYPTLQMLRDLVEAETPDYRVEVADDIVLIAPDHGSRAAPRRQRMPAN